MARGSRGRRRRTAAAAATAVVGLVSGPGVDARPAVATEPVRIIQHNICGAICNDGVAVGTDDDPAVVDEVRHRILAEQPHLVTLQEVCVGQFDQLRESLEDSAWPMDGVFRAQRIDDRCAGGFGDAVLTAGVVGATEVVDLPDRGSEDRAVICLHTDAEGPVLACSLHLVTGRHKGHQERLDQLATVAEAFNARAEDEAVVVAGDFNTGPSGMDALLDPEQGRFFDVDPEAEETHGQKIDYVLLSHGHFTDPTGGPAESERSDHWSISGQVLRRS